MGFGPQGGKELDTTEGTWLFHSSPPSLGSHSTFSQGLQIWLNNTESKHFEATKICL